MNVIDGFSFARSVAAEIVRSYVTRRYSCSDIPAEETPRQKKQASSSCSSVATPVRSDRSLLRISTSLGCGGAALLRETETTRVTSGSSRHSRRTPCPIMPVAPKRMTCMREYYASAGSKLRDARAGGGVRMTQDGAAMRRGSRAIFPGERPRDDRVGCVPEDLAPRDRVADDCVDQH